MSSYDPPGSQWVRPRTLVEQWVASWAPSEAQHRAAWMAEAAKQSQRAALKYVVQYNKTAGTHVHDFGMESSEEGVRMSSFSVRRTVISRCCFCLPHRVFLLSFFPSSSFLFSLLLCRRQELGHIRRGENDTVFYSAGSQGRKDSYIEKLFKQRAEAKKDEQPADE
jgi:hypothetical protein